MVKKIVQNLLFKDLSYQIDGAAIEVRKDFGPGHKEVLYQKAFAEELKRKKIPFENEKTIKIYSPKDGKYVGLYRPDFIIDNKIIVEIKAEKFVSRNELKRIYDYLRNSQYELAYFINFASPKLFIKRVIYTNERKPFLKKLLVSISLLLVLFSGLSAEGAVLYLEPSEGVYYQGDTFLVEVRLDTEGEEINTVKADLTFSQELLKVKDFSQGNSVLTFWPEGPSLSNQKGTISFIGGIPGGYQGDGLLGRIVFRVVSRPVSRSFAEVVFQDDSQVLLNDGSGTPAELAMKIATFTILPEKLEVPEDEWRKELEKDDISPEPFEIIITQDPFLFGGRYFIVFHTQDKQTGMGYYEVKEGKKDWKRGESPYLLEDQSLKSKILVKAVDKAGNERIAEWLPPKPFPWWIVILILIGLGIIWRILKRIITKSTRRIVDV